jgi:hypothetical protein
MFRQPEMLMLLDRFTVPSLRERAKQLGTDAFWDSLARGQYQRAAELALADAEAVAVNRIQLENFAQRRDESVSDARETAERERQARESESASVIQTVLKGVLIRPPAIVVEQQSEQTTEPAPLPGVVVPATEEPSLDQAIDAWAAWYAEQGT